VLKLAEFRSKEKAMATEAGRRLVVERPGSRLQAVQIETRARVEFKDITALVEKLVEQSSVQNGTCLVFVPHTTAAILINENDDPALQKDLDAFLKQIAPREAEYHHNDGNCDAHLKASVIGCSKALLIENGRLVLGTWQGVFFCEFDGPRRRELRVKIVSD
jgi:secondary thiamine-phosphate synthase enzyme